MSYPRSVYIAGGAITPFIGKFHPDFIWKGHPDFGQRQNPTLEEYLHRVIRSALADVQIDASRVDRGFVGNFVGELFSNQGHLGSMAIAADPGLLHKPFLRIEGACASGGLALACGIDAIQAGARVVLVVGVEVQTTRNALDGADFLARAAHYEKERGIDPFTFPALFARRAKAYFERHGGGPEDLGTIVEKAYANANRNPNAHMRSVKMSREEASTPSESNPCFLENPDLRDYLKVSDCSQISDGACCVILVSNDGLEYIGEEPGRAVEVIAHGVAAGPLGQVEDYTRLNVTSAAASLAYSSAGWDATDPDFAEVHDCFSISEALICEALGFCKEGEGIALAASGGTSIDGKIPVNTGGGLIAFGHPVGATGVKQAYEIFRQLNGECGDYQISDVPHRAISANIGGDDRTSVVTLYEKS